MTNEEISKYTDFEIFLSDASILLRKSNNISQNWLKAIEENLGLMGLIKILNKLDPPIENKKYMIGGLLSVSDILNEPPEVTYTNMYSDEILKKIPGKRNNLTLKDEKESIQRAEIIFNEIRFSNMSPERKKKNIDKLFEDIVSGDKIFY